MATEPIAVSAITLDFGNTLVRVDRASLRGVVEETAEVLQRLAIVDDRPEFLAAWAEERDRQFREDVPLMREVDIAERAVRVLARLRGTTPPAPDERWDDEAAALQVAPAEVDAVVDAYSSAFVHRMRAVDDARSTLEQLSGRGFRLGVLSNWPLALTIDRFAENQGWMPFLEAIVVSQRVGFIKPYEGIFRAAEDALGIGQDRRDRILHVGDDWAADVIGARKAGWRVAYLRDRQLDTPLPTSEPGDGLELDVPVEPDLVIDELSDIDSRVVFDERTSASAGPNAGPGAAASP